MSVGSRAKGAYLVPMVSKTLDILEMLQAEKQAISLESVYRRTNFPKTTVYRIVKTLESRGYLARQENGMYRTVSQPSKIRFGFGGQSEDLPFSQAVTASLREAAAAAGIELLVLDNRYDARIAIQNAEKFVEERVDLVIEFQIDQNVAPVVADKIASIGIPLIAVEIPHPHATYFGVDNYRVGHVAGEFLAQYATRAWRKNVSWVLGLDIEEAGPLVQSRITGAFEGVRESLPEIPAECFVRMDSRGLSDKSYRVTAEFLQRHPRDQGILIAAADDTSALGALHAVKQSKREKHIAIVGQDCIPEALEEIRVHGSPFIGSVSREVHTYGRRLVQLGRALVRGQEIAPYHYVDHKLITAEVLATESHAHALIR